MVERIGFEANKSSEKENKLVRTIIAIGTDLLGLFAFRVLVVRSGRLSNLHNLLGE